MEQLSWHTSHSGLFSTISSAFLTNLCLLSVIIPNRGLLKSSTMIVHLSIYPCNSVSFCFAYFDAVSWTNLWLVWPFGGLSIYCYVISHFIPISAISEKAMAPHSSTLAWKLPWMEEPGRLQSMGLLRVGHDSVTSLSLSCIGEGNGNPLQCSCLEIPRDGGAWWAAVYGVAQSRTLLKRLSSSSSSIPLGICTTTSLSIHLLMDI